MHRDKTSAEYFREREQQERESAAKAEQEVARPIHLSQAEGYRLKAQEAERE